MTGCLLCTVNNKDLSQLILWEFIDISFFYFISNNFYLATQKYLSQHKFTDFVQVDLNVNQNLHFTLYILTNDWGKSLHINYT